MKILFLHGWQSIPGGVKPTFLAQAGHEVINPKLPDDDFAAARALAQTEYDVQQRPDVIVGSSRGGAVAMNLDCGDTPLVLLCPAWKKYGWAKNVKPGTTILHSRADDVIPFADSEELVRNSGLPTSALIQVGTDHRLADSEPLMAMLRACLRIECLGAPRNRHRQAIRLRVELHLVHPWQVVLLHVPNSNGAADGRVHVGALRRAIRAWRAELKPATPNHYR